MRSLQEWLKYVDSQAEAARRKKFGEEERPDPAAEQTQPKATTPPATAKALISFGQTAPEPGRRTEPAKPARGTPPLPDITQYIPGLREITSREKDRGVESAKESAPPKSAEPQEVTGKPLDAPQPRPTSVEPAPTDTKGWHKLPRQLQLLLSSASDEVASRYYKPFRESREELIRRLLDPELSLEEAARVLGVCPTTVRRYTNKGYLPHYRTAGNQRRFRLSDILEFMERRGALSGLPLLDREDDEPE